jgi:hypothetical protein
MKTLNLILYSEVHKHFLRKRSVELPSRDSWPNQINHLKPCWHALENCKNHHEIACSLFCGIFGIDCYILNMLMIHKSCSRETIMN